MQSIAACPHHPAEHLFGYAEALGVRNEEESGLGCSPIGETVTDDLQLFAVLLDDDSADM